jgi:hypothetical protein
MANKNGERAEPCITPRFILKKSENASNHLTQDQLWVYGLTRNEGYRGAQLEGDIS